MPVSSLLQLTQLTDGRRFRILTVVDDCTRECLALIADTSLSGARVARELATLFDTGAPDFAELRKPYDERLHVNEAL